MSDEIERAKPTTPEEIQAILDDFSERWSDLQASPEDYERARTAGKALATLFVEIHGCPARPEDVVWRDKEQEVVWEAQDYSGEDFAGYLCDVRVAALWGTDTPGEGWTAEPNPAFHDTVGHSPHSGAYAWDDWATAEQAQQAVAKLIVEGLGITPVPGSWQADRWETQTELDRIRREYAQDDRQG
jgi:hypothetical protein